MKKVIHGRYKLLAALMAALLLLTAIPLNLFVFGKNNVAAIEKASREDRRIASEISNQTGASIEDIFILKNAGRSWNQVLEVLHKKYSLGAAGSNRDGRDSLLLNTGLDQDFIARIRKEGFSGEEIDEVKMLEERVAYQLQEISAGSTAEVESPRAGTGSANDANNLSAAGISSTNENSNSSNTSDSVETAAYEALAKKVDAKNAIYFMLKLKAGFRSYEKAFDEYLYALQLDIDLNEYIKDKKAYLKKKDEKKALIDERKIITLQMIEEKSLEKIQNDNKSNDPVIPAGKNSNAAAGKEAAADKSPLPEVLNAGAADMKPKNPTDEVMNEIKAINPLERAN